MKFLKRFLLALCLIFVVLVAIFYAQKIQEKRMVNLQTAIHTYLTAMGNLETMKIDYQKDVNVWLDVLPNLINPWIVNKIEKAKTYSFEWNVSAGLNLKELQLSGVNVVKWYIVKLNLPTTKILETSTSYIPEVNTGITLKTNDAMIVEATKKAVQAMNEAANSQNILELAKVNAEKNIKEMLLKKYTNVKDVIFE